jgi:hypothetical protein
MVARRARSTKAIIFPFSLQRFTIFRPISENLETLFPGPENGQKGGLINEFLDCV